MPKVAVKTECVHHWIVDWFDYGVCKLCGEERQFTPRGTIDWGRERMTGFQNGQPERVILPQNFREEV